MTSPSIIELELLSNAVGVFDYSDYMPISLNIFKQINFMLKLTV